MNRSSASAQPAGVLGWLLAWTLEFMLHGQVRLGGASGIWACSGPGMARAGAAARMHNHGKQRVPEGRQDSPRGLLCLTAGIERSEDSAMM